MEKIYLAQVPLKGNWQFADIPAFGSLGGFVTYMLPNVMIVAGVIFFVMVVLAGVGIVTGAGGGDAHGQEKLKSFLTFSVTGLIIIFCAYWIMQIINFITSNSLGDIIK